MKQRIWELDALRGICLLGMFAIHITFDLVVLYDVWDLSDPRLFNFSQDWGGMPFLVLSGLCATLGSRPVRRGLLVFLCGMLCTLTTAGMYWLDFSGKSIIIYFGVLHCLGCCMMLWPVFRKLPTWLLAVLGVVIITVGLYLVRNITVDFVWLTPFGIPSHTFSSSDYFPLLPNLGYFLVGSALGRTLYRNKTSLLPSVNQNIWILRFLRFFGKHSLLIYLLHQPILAGVIALLLPLF